jgi:hypothetical protein
MEILPGRVGEHRSRPARGRGFIDGECAIWLPLPPAQSARSPRSSAPRSRRAPRVAPLGRPRSSRRWWCRPHRAELGQDATQHADARRERIAVVLDLLGQEIEERSSPLSVRSNCMPDLSPKTTRLSRSPSRCGEDDARERAREVALFGSRASRGWIASTSFQSWAYPDGWAKNRGAWPRTGSEARGQRPRDGVCGHSFRLVRFLFFKGGSARHRGAGSTWR